LRVTAAVHRFINYVKQYEKCDPVASEIPLSVPLLAGNCEPDNLSSYHIFFKSWLAAVSMGSHVGLKGGA